jgi:hypothetical protein
MSGTMEGMSLRWNIWQRYKPVVYLPMMVTLQLSLTAFKIFSLSWKTGLDNSLVRKESKEFNVSREW